MTGVILSEQGGSQERQALPIQSSTASLRLNVRRSDDKSRDVNFILPRAIQERVVRAVQLE